MTPENKGKNYSWEVFSGPNFGYVLEMYDQYLEDPNSVDEETRELFNHLGAPGLQTNGSAPTMQQQQTIQHDFHFIKKVVAAEKFIQDIRTYGHLYAKISPLEENDNENNLIAEHYNLTSEELKNIPAHLVWNNSPKGIQHALDAVESLKEIYSNKLAFEFNHVHDTEEREWLTNNVESNKIYKTLTNDEKVSLLHRLTEVEEFERFLHQTFVGQKRFSIEGLDCLVPMLDEIIKTSVHDGAENIMVGMAHRGRLNVLAHVLNKPYEIIFSEFHLSPDKELVPSEGSTGINYGWTGDVKYHLGADRAIKDDNIREAVVTLANNPSHLEFVDPVVEGFARAAQENRSAPGYPQQDTSKALPILIHGDAAFPGEGVVAETLNLGQLPGYTTGGTVHIIANNLLGFTSEKKEARSTKYASDLAKGYEIPIVHVNADDPEACLAAIQLAHEYRKRFKKDFLIDLIGYRRFGHNEMDDPSPTQPILYKKIKAHPTVKTLYKQTLEESGIIDSNQFNKIESEVKNKLDSAYKNLTTNEHCVKDELDPPETISKGIPDYDTSVPIDVLNNVNNNILQVPDKFNTYPKLKRILEKRGKVFATEGKVDWSLSEALAFATILKDGTPIRMTGQDSERGTFAHRHIVLRDFETGEKFSPLHVIPEVNASFAIHNSPLSETSVMGFEYGYNVFAPETLVLWEAQFGDFVNVSQVIIDQFISAGRAKWGQKSSLTLLLPHGYEGQGPEHSSARLERFLTLAAEGNWTIVNLTNAAQYFHVLRRQAALCGEFQARPLIIMTPKGLIRSPRLMSTSNELTEGTFKTVIEGQNTGHAPEKVERLILCSGKIAIDIEEKLEEIEELENIHIVRVEQLYPFPRTEIGEIIDRLPNLKEITWVQEEPRNMGAWMFVQPRLNQLAGTTLTVNYIGRAERSSPATGEPNVHRTKQERIVNKALNIV